MNKQGDSGQELTPLGISAVIKKRFGDYLNYFKQRLKLVGIVFAVIVIVIITLVVRSFFGDGGDTSLLSGNKALSQFNDNELAVGGVVFSLPAGSIDEGASVYIDQIAEKKAPKVAKGDKIVGGVYDVKVSGTTLDENKPAYLTFEYDPGSFPDGTSEKNLYLAHYNGSEWEPVPGAVVDPETKTITAPVNEFSFFSAVISMLDEYLRSDVIEARERFADLPDDIKQDLDRQYSQSSIKSGLYWRVSPISKGASETILIANFINNISGGIIAAVDGGGDMVQDWLMEEIVLKAGETVITETVGEKEATVVLALYDTASTGVELYSEGFSAIKSAPMLQVKAVAWVLARQMDYINANVGEGYSKIAELNLWQKLSGDNSPLEVYVVSVHGEHKETGMMDKGVKFYYLNTSSGKHENYANAVVGTKLKSVEVIGGEEEEEVVPTSTPAPAKPAPKATSKPTSSASGCQKLDLTKDSQWYYSSDAANPCSSFTKSLTSDRFSIRCPNSTSRWRDHFVREIDTQGKGSLQIKANLGLNVIDRFFIENNGIGVKYDDYVDLIILSSDPTAELSSQCNGTWNNSTKPPICAIQNTDSGVIGHCGVQKWKASRTCDFTVNTSGKSKVWAVLRTADAWPADPEGSLSNLRVCY